MSVMFTIQNSVTDGVSASVILDGEVLPAIHERNPNYQEVSRMLIGLVPMDENRLRELVLPASVVGVNLRRLSERITYDSTTQNILFDGDTLDNAVAEHIIRILDEGGNTDSYSSLVAFLEKLYQNPSEESREALYSFMVRHNLTIDPDGDFYAYKGVKSDLGSIHSGFGIVNGVTMNGSLKNAPGSIVEIPRSQVNTDRNIGCSTGLHVGSYSYARGFSQGALLTVKVNPRDVVSVPTDCAYQKIRVSRYKVVTTETVELQSTTYTLDTYTADDPVGVSDLEALLEAGYNPQVGFTYMNGNGDEVTRSGEVLRVEVRGNRTFVVVAKENTDEPVYFDYSKMSNICLDEQFLDENEELTDADNYNEYDDYDIYDDDYEAQDNLDVVLPTTPAEVLRFFGDYAGEEQFINFDYVKVDGTPRRVENFTATETDAHRNIIRGIREDGLERAYRADRIHNVSVNL